MRKILFKKPFKNFNFNINGRHPSFTVLSHFGTQFTTRKPKTLLKTKTYAKTTSLGKSNSVRPRSQKNHRILVKLNKKETIFGPNLGLNCPLQSYQSVVRNPQIVYNWNILLNVLNTKFQFLRIFCSRLYLEEVILFVGLGPNCNHFVGFGDKNSSKQHPID